MRCRNQCLQKVKDGNITALLHKIKPAIDRASKESNGSNEDAEFIERVATFNVLEAMEEIRDRSPIINDLEKENKIMVVGAIYDVETGQVSFFEN